MVQAQELDEQAPLVERGENCGTSPKARKAADIALGLMGAARLEPSVIAEGATWQNGGRSLLGREAVVAQARKAKTEYIRIDEIVTHGKAAAVSGQMRRAGKPPALFCHMIKFSSAAALQVASVISFDHSIKERKK